MKKSREASCREADPEQETNKHGRAAKFKEKIWETNPDHQNLG